MKQQKIANWLKGLVILLGIMGVLFFGGVTIFAFKLKQNTDTGLLWTFVFGSWYIAALCYAILYQFWKVCGEIAKDNSFSMENAEAFHKMGNLGIAAGIGYLVRIILLAFVNAFNIWALCYSVFSILLTIVFYGLCEALARLIQNAYEVKLENELTI